MSPPPRRASRAEVYATLVAVLLLGGCAVAGPDPSPQAAARSGAAGTTATPAYPPGLTVYPVSQRRVVPDLRGTTLAGTPLELSSLRGHVVVLNVWASWCEPCRTESPDLAALATSTEATGTRFVGLDEQDTTTAATAFLRSVQADYPHLVDDGALLARLSDWLPPAVPGSLVVDRDGLVAARAVGKVTADEFVRFIAQLAGTP